MVITIFILFPMLLMVLIPLLRAKFKVMNQIYFSLLVSIVFILVFWFFQKGKIIVNSKLAQFTAFFLFPTLFCVGVARIKQVWKYQVMGIICIPIVYFIGWIISINIGMLIGVLRP